jgi:hypothetical protein
MAIIHGDHSRMTWSNTMSHPPSSKSTPAPTPTPTAGPTP